MSRLPICVCAVETAEGSTDYVTCLSHDQVFEHGLPTEAILGVLLRPLAAGEAITPEVFALNRAFVDFMHGIIERRGPELPGLIAEARRQGDGLVVVVDQRTATPHDAVPPEDIIGVFEVKGGTVAPGSYQPSPKHLILSSAGFFQLGSELQSCLLEEISALANKPKANNRGGWLSRLLRRTRR